MMAALFPQAAACQGNVAGPVEIPDHPIVRQTMHDTAAEGLDIDGLTELLDGIETVGSRSTSVTRPRRRPSATRS